MAARSYCAVPADRTHPLHFETPARWSVFELSAGSSLTIAALGVVYGDIGTSPLYAVRQCFAHGVGVSEPRVFGVLSMIAWALTLVVTLKYVIVLMRADNRGEGGILALTVLALRAAGARRSRWILATGLLGAALFYELGGQIEL